MHEQYAHMICERREEILARMDAAVRMSGRTLDDVELVAVSKTVGIPEVLAAIDAGYRTFGENRPQELMRKLEGLGSIVDLPSVRFDMIGNLQTNKINATLGRVKLIHSIGSLHLAEAVSSRAARRMEAGELKAPQPVLIEVNVSGEETKGGFAPNDLRRHMDQLQNLCGIDIRGLMTMAPRGNKDVARSCFSDLRDLRDELAVSSGLALPELSCGMSEDFEAALVEGSTIVRLGRVVFDPMFEVL
ncbi:YggS family pyridoxal phosphate-dependent enzyme [Collinsella provencensis]|uniref:YggS family pyridoxal phosphate-dependent enzyme n=1 Tax=Collinsella provencensis TaxID=1937461 RepID=UPI000C815242|nr:YggS family pyridoxal phosphate-dependent enzyme [Collinsella provencensis]